MIMISVEEKMGHLEWMSVLLAIGSALCAALYKVFLRYRIKDCNMSATAVLLSTIGLVDLTIFWIAPFTLDMLHKEEVHVHDIPWFYLVLQGVGSFAFNALVNFGITYTTPLFISLGIVAGVPLNLVVDCVFRHVHVGYMKAIGSVCIVAGFLCLLMPLSWRINIVLWKGGAGD